MKKKIKLTELERRKRKGVDSRLDNIKHAKGKVYAKLSFKLTATNEALRLFPLSGVAILCRFFFLLKVCLQQI